MKILYIGDIMAKPGRELVIAQLPAIKKKYRPDLIIAQAENVSHGKSMTPTHMRELQQAGIDFFTGGNHTLWRKALYELLDDPDEPVIRPANLAGDLPGLGWKVAQTAKGSVQVISLLGDTFPESENITNPLRRVDEILEQTKQDKFAARIVNFHGDFSSEKRIIGYYLDGRVTAVIGDHWHVPTADAMVLPRGTAHITDVGMCGTLHSSLGVKAERIITRWRDGEKNKNDIEENGPFQFSAVLIESNTTGLASKITQIHQTY